MMIPRTIHKAVFPVAGMGTRFLPATKAMPKELLPIIDKPIIQHAVEEALEAGITNLIFVTGRTKRAIEDHFDANPELENALSQRGNEELVDVVRNIIPSHVNCVFVRQPNALGLGHAVLCAEPAVGGEPFAVLLPDDLMAGLPRPTKDLVAHYENTGRLALSVMNMPNSQLEKYGIIDPILSVSRGAHQVLGIVEKPAFGKAPSNLAAVGRYVLDSSIFDELRQTKPGVGGEIQLTDALNVLAENAMIDAIEFSGLRYDCGSKIGYLEAIVDFALNHPDLGPSFLEIINARIFPPRRIGNNR